MKAALFGFSLLLAAGCGSRTDEVVVYTSVDDVYAREIFAAFKRETGIRVLPVFDTEEAKTLGLVHRLLAEKAAPQCDVFWSGECARTILLKKQGALETYRPSTAKDIPARWVDPDGTWTGFSVRSRVIVYNTARVPQPPKNLKEIAQPAWKGRVAIANPLFGTTATHLIALSQLWGDEPVLAFLRALRANDVRVVGGNSHVRDLVARGECDLGLTDTDDVYIGKARGDAIAIANSGFESGDLCIIPNTAALIKGAPHPENGRRFLDWLLRRETEEMLYKGPAQQLPIRMLPKDLPTPPMDWERLAAGEPFLLKAKEALGL
jgi:iron(III) transport system substrate-binding protein